MSEKMKGILIIACGLVLVLFSVYAQMSADQGQEVMKDAVYVEDGMVHPENEGKGVIMVFDMNKLSKECTDTDLGYTFNAPMVQRRVDVFEKASAEKDGEISCRWSRVYNGSEEALTQAVFLGKADPDVLIPDDQLLRAIPEGEDITKTLMREDSYGKLTAEYGEYLADGHHYFSKATAGCFGSSEDLKHVDTIYQNNVVEAVGELRFAYSDIDAAYQDKVTFYGVQKGNMLVKDQSADAGFVYEGSLTKEEVLDQNKSGMGSSIGIMIGLGVLLAVFGLVYIKKKA